MAACSKKACFISGVVLLGSFSLLFLIIAIATPPLLNKAVEGQVKDNVVMTPANEDTWGEIPGKYNLSVLRHVTLFNFSNGIDVLYNNAKPVFKMIDEVTYQEK
jgi:hypothetical protein